MQMDFEAAWLVQVIPLGERRAPVGLDEQHL